MTHTLGKWISTLVLIGGAAAAAAQGDDERLRAGWAAFELGDAYLALRRLDPLATAGNKYAQYTVAELLLPGKQVPP